MTFEWFMAGCIVLGGYAWGSLVTLCANSCHKKQLLPLHELLRQALVWHFNCFIFCLSWRESIPSE